MQHFIKNCFRQLLLTAVAGSLVILQSCSTGQATEKNDPPEVAVMTIDTLSAILSKRFPANLEGISNVEIRPQAEGYLEKMFVDEGAFVQKGQPLFLINEQPYNEQLNTTRAAFRTAEANRDKAQIEVKRLEKLVAGKVISQVQLDNAQAVLDAANASVAEAAAVQQTAVINKGFTLIKAPVSGYIGRIPYKTGSLISRNDPQPLTLLSDIHEMYAYFSMSEKDFLLFKQRYSGASLEDKIRHIPPVTLLLPDNTAYPEKGKVEMVQGQFAKTTAAITFRVSFPNPGGLLRSGNTGTLVIPYFLDRIIYIPQAATFEMQNKVMVYLVGVNNTLRNAVLGIGDKDDKNYIVTGGLKPGDRIVVSGTERLHEDMTIKPVSQ